MKRENIFSALMVLFALAGLSSCVMEFNNESADSGEIVLSITLPKLEVATRSTEAGSVELNENKVNNYHIFIFKVSAADNIPNVCNQSIVPSAAAARYALTKKRGDFEEDEEYEAYVIANHDFIETENISRTDLKALNVAIVSDAKQDCFLMSGKSAALKLNDSQNSANLDISVTLTRAASKIRVNLVYSEDYEPKDGEKATRQLMNYAQQGRLLSDGTTYTPTLSDGGIGKVGSVSYDAAQIIAYSMPNDWNSDPARETFIWLNVPRDNWNNYYKVTLSPTPEMERNHLYDVSVLINKPGGATLPEAVPLEVNYQIRNWATLEVLLEVANIKYLFVRDKEIVLPNSTDAATLFYSSSPVTVTGSIVTGLNASGYFTYDQDVNNGEIRIACAVPTNYMARTIELTVENEEGLSETVTIIQYPPFCIDDSIKSTVSSDNNNLYVVTAYSIDLRSAFPDIARGLYGAIPGKEENYHAYLTGYYYGTETPYGGPSAKIGYPLLDQYGCTIETEDNARLISPSFMFASKAGETSVMKFDEAKRTCWNYSERDTSGELHLNWRLPTASEIRLIDAMQNLPSATIINILSYRSYWVAYNSYSQQRGRSNEMIASSIFPGHDGDKGRTRCVRDIGRK